MLTLLFLVPPIVLLIVTFFIFTLDGEDIYTPEDRKDFYLGAFYLSLFVSLSLSVVYWIILLIIFGIKYLLQ